MVTVSGSCHCGATRFTLAEAPREVTRCTCTFCSKRGVLWAYYTPAEFRLETPRTHMATYRAAAGSGLNAHHFCPTCGCGLFSETPDWSKGEPDLVNPRIGVNARLLDDFDLKALPVTVIDGRNLW